MSIEAPDTGTTRSGLVARPILRKIAYFWWVASVASGAASLVTDQAIHMFFGSLLAAIVSIPFLGRTYNLLSPWTPLALAIMMSCGLRGSVLSLSLEGRRPFEELWTLGYPPEHFVPGYAIYALGMAVATGAYMFFAGRRRPLTVEPRPTKLTFNDLFWPIVIACALIGFVSFALYVQNTGGFSPADLSRKRTTISGLELSSDYQSYGVLRYLNELGALAFWLTLARFRFERAVTLSASVGRSVLLLGLFLSAIALPIYASSRGDVANIIVVAVAIRLLIGSGGLRLRALVALGLVLVTLMSLMTFFRASAQGGVFDEISLGALIQVAPEGTVYDRNFGGLATTAHIIAAVPEQLPYANGETIATWLVAPIPRAVWPDKPLITAGPIIGSTIYNTDQSGVPPGYVGEMYWNFGVAGVVGGAVVLGMILAAIERRYSLDRLVSDPKTTILYAVVFLRFGMFALSGGLGAALFGLATDLVVAVVVLRLIAPPEATPADHRRRSVRGQAMASDT